MALQGVAVHGSALTLCSGESAAEVAVFRDERGAVLRGRPGENASVLFAVPTLTVKLGPDTGDNFRSLLRMVYVLWRGEGARPTRVTVSDGPNVVYVADVENLGENEHDGALPPEYEESDPADFDIEAVVQSSMRLGVSRWPTARADGSSPSVLWGIAIRVDVVFEGAGSPEILFTTAGADFTVPDE
ncbi:hypothetical protein [Streptosporangium sp. LJ11]|uniref:hypothetical protein n=1 Tax=Streptosporangium sp. LJ11 TaxID=3436927 RepID=UPI003F79FE1F